jgi:subtilase family serine protease
VTTCGGTTIDNVSGSSFTQATWNDNGATGGGISYSFALPSWQNGVGVPSSANGDGRQGRGIPDVAGNADPNSGYTLVLNGAPDGPIGGTSAVAPLYAGLVALLNATLGRPVGYLNPNPFLIPLGQRSLVDQQSNGSIKCGPRNGSEGAANTDSSDPGIGQIRDAHVGTDQQNIDRFRRNG